MPSKYYRLSEYLQERHDSEWVASFADIEKIIGRALPASARQHHSWWANRPLAQGHTWLSAGWRVTRPDLQKQQVTFVCFVNGNADGSPNMRQGKKVRTLTVAEAKAGLATNFGVPISRISITVRL
jgi:hypothetical protein